jgi:hypothetical protein
MMAASRRQQRDGQPCSSPGSGDEPTPLPRAAAVARLDPALELLARNERRSACAAAVFSFSGGRRPGWLTGSGRDWLSRSAVCGLFVDCGCVDWQMDGWQIRVWGVLEPGDNFTGALLPATNYAYYAALLRSVA